MLNKYILIFTLFITPFVLIGQINNTDKGAATIYTKGLPTGAVRIKYDSEWAIDVNTSKIYRYDRTNSAWLLAGSMIGFQNNANVPTGAPKYGAPEFILNNTGGLYGYYSSAWHCLNCASIGYTEGTGIDITGNVITNTLPDQTVTLGNGTGISVTGTYPNFTITNTAPDQTVTLTGAGITNISGTYPNFTITSTEVDGSTTNEIQQIDTFTLSGDTLKLSLSSDGVPYKQVILTGLSSLSGGIYGPSDTVTYHHTAVIDSGLTFRSYEDTSYFNILTGLNYGSFLTLKPDSTLIRWFDVGGNNQILLNSDGINLSTTNPDRLTITGNDTRYTSDYRATYNDRSITDKKYQDDFYLQEVDTFRISNDTLFISLIRDSVPESFVVLSGLGGSSTDTSGYNLNFRISNDTLYIRDGNDELFVTIPLPNVYNLDIITPLPSVDVEGSIVLKTVDVNGSKILYVSNGTDWVEGGLFLDTLNVATINMGNDQVTYAKIQEVTAERLLGNPTGSTANPSEISLGSGLGFSGSTILNTGDLSTTNEIQQLDTFEIVSNVLRASLGLDGVPFKSVDLSPYLDNTDSSGYNSAFTRSGDTLFITDGLSTKFVVLPSGIVDTDDQTLSLSNDTLYISQGNSVFLRQYLDNTDSQQLSIDSSIVEGVERFTISLDSSTSISFDIPQVTDTDNQRIDTFSITNGVVSLSLQDDALPASTIDITESVQDITGGMVESNTETGITVTYDDATGKLNFVTVDQSLTNELQFPDTFEIVSDVLRLSLFNDGLPYKSVDLSPYLDNTDAQSLTITGASSPFTLDISGSASDINFASSTGIALTESPANTLVITNSAPDQTVSITGAGISNVTGTYPNFTITSTEIDGSTTNEIQTIDTFTIVSNILRLSLLNDGLPFNSVDLSSYLDNTDSQTLSIDSTDLTGIERYAISISNGNTIYLDDDDRQTLSIDSTTVGTSERFTLSVSEGNNVSFDIPQGTVTGTGTAPQVALWNSTNGLTGSSTLTYQTNTMSFLPTTKDTILYVLGEGGNYFGVSTHVDTFNAAATAYKIGALNRNGRVYITSYETYLQGAFRQVEGSGIEFRGTTGSFFLHPNGDQYSGTTTGDNATHNRNLHWYFTSGGTFYGNPVVFQHNFSSNDSTGNSFEFLARNTASGGITIPDSTLFRVGNWDRGVALEIKHSRDVGLKTKSPRVALDINDTDAVILPSGTTAQRPGTPYAGAIRFNSDSTAMEYGNGSAWVTFGAGTGGGTNIYNSDGRIKDGGTVVDVGLNNALIFDLDSNALLDNRVIYMQVETDNDVTYTRWLSMVAPTDSFRISSFDQTIYMEFEGVTGAGEGLVISSNTILDLRADSTKLTGAPIRSEAHYLTGWYNNTLSKIEGTTNGQVLVWDETAGNWELGSGGGAIADADYGDITVSSSGTVWNIDAGVVGNTEIGSGAGGIYKGDGTLSSGTTNATLPASGILRFEYNGGNAGLIVDDANSTSSIFSKDGTQFLSADNTQVLVGSGTSKMEYIDGVLRVYDSDATQYIAIQTPATGSLTSNYTITLPADDGTLDQFLKTDGNGGLSWATIAGGGDILNGGNTTGAALTIGTNDANALNFEINNTTALTLGTTYGLTATAAIATTNTVTDRIAIHSTSTTTPSAGFGSAIVFQGESSTNDNRDMARIAAEWTTVTDASRRADLVFSVASSTAVSEYMRIKSGSTVGISIGSTGSGTLYHNAGINAGISYTIGNSSNGVTIGGSTGTVSLTSSNTGTGAISLSSTSTSSALGISLGNSSYTSNTLAKTGVRIGDGYAPTAGTGTYTGFGFTGTFNQTGGANGIIRGIYLNQTLTAVADFRAIEIAANEADAKGIYQTGSSTTNNFVGGTMFGSTSAPASVAAIEISSTTKGLLLPRMTTTQRDAITAVAGLVIYNTTTTKMECYDGATWQAAW